MLAGKLLWQQGCAGTRIQGDRNRNLPFCSDVIQFSRLDIGRANRLGQANGCVYSPDKLPVTTGKHKPGLTEQNCPGIPHWISNKRGQRESCLCSLQLCSLLRPSAELLQRAKEKRCSCLLVQEAAPEQRCHRFGCKSPSWCIHSPQSRFTFHCGSAVTLI